MSTGVEADLTESLLTSRVDGIQSGGRGVVDAEIERWFHVMHYEELG